MLIGYIQLESHIILSTDHYIRKLADEDMAILFNIKPGQKPYHTVQNKFFNNSCFKGKSGECSDDPTYQSPVLWKEGEKKLMVAKLFLSPLKTLW